MAKTISERASIAGQAYQFGKTDIESDSKVFERGYIQGAEEERAEIKEYLEKKRDSMTLFPTEYDMCQEIINELLKKD